MGNVAFKSKKPKKKIEGEAVVCVEDNEALTDVENFNNYDFQIIETIRRDLNETPELFVLNNVLMGIMFFKNYKKDIEDISIQRNEDSTISLAPDLVLEKISENVRYRPFHGPKKHQSEPITNKRVFVFNENIEVLAITDDVDGISRKSIVRIEESPRKGFVKLREVETRPPSPNELIPFAVNSESESNSRCSSTDSDTQSAPASISDLRTPKPIEIAKHLEAHNEDSLPGSCITYRRVKKPVDEIDLEGRCIEDITEDDIYHTVSYISSRCYMKFFQNVMFPNNVAGRLGFKEDDIQNSEAIPGKVFCMKEEVVHEVVPSIRGSWPSHQTLEFIMKAQQNPEPRKRRIFPTESMISEILNMHCALVPRGYFKKRGERVNSDIEWELSFPQAERYLESYMSHAQIKCLLFLLAIHKTYIEPKTLQMGLLPEHIRCFMLWECEKNYSDWPEHRLGIKLIHVLNDLYQHLSKNHLPDYFVKERNLLENVPKRYIRIAQKVFHDILESPFPGMLRAVRNLRYMDGKSFYPPLDLNEIYTVLVEPKNKREESMDMKIITDINYDNFEMKWKQIKTLKKKEELKKLEETRRESVDSIDMNWTCEKKLNVLKKRTLLTLFINSFLDIASKSSTISSKKQTLLYFKQARYLTKILKDEKLFFDEAVEYFHLINSEEDKCMKRYKDETNVVVASDDAVSNENVDSISIAESNSNSVADITAYPSSVNNNSSNNSGDISVADSKHNNDDVSEKSGDDSDMEIERCIPDNHAVSVTVTVH